MQIKEKPQFYKQGVRRKMSERYVTPEMEVFVLDDVMTTDFISNSTVIVPEIDATSNISFK